MWRRPSRAPALTGVLEAETGADLAGSFLRIEYCQDTDGFWLEPHTDIGAKLFTMLVYLSDRPEAEGWGTDIYDGARRHLGAAPGGFNKGLIFVPGSRHLARGRKAQLRRRTQIHHRQLRHARMAVAARTGLPRPPHRLSATSSAFRT